MLSIDDLKLIAGFIIIIVLFYLYVLPLIKEKNAEFRIENLTMKDFCVIKKECIKTINTKEFDIKVKKDKEGKLYYYDDGGLYYYGSTPRLTLAINDTTKREHTYYITKSQYKNFLTYIDGVDSIDVIAKEIHFILQDSIIKEYKLRTKDTTFYIGKLIIPNLTMDEEFKDEELENVLSAIKEDLKVSDSLERLKETV